ncbi:hypothetical protein RvY_18036 [Ramazzottius varieornatus]|uniref:Uncharacterized protein n=1 Tax=Ramazzottius varieornatus TaxID=947166 RepID=A0A1D1W9R0_RAMVA|nr:hypothetical protein RvY_18036 [Ramazzottius varieornatus]
MYDEVARRPNGYLQMKGKFAALCRGYETRTNGWKMRANESETTGVLRGNLGTGNALHPETSTSDYVRCMLSD